MHLYSSKILACNFLFLMVPLSYFDITVMVISRNIFGSIPSYSIFWKSWRRIDISHSMYPWYNLPMKPSGPGVLFVGSFLFFFLTESFSHLVICLFKLSISS